jgi:Ca-activated chloride channel family protein
MKRLVSLTLLLFMLTCVSVLSHAQSGRRRTVQGQDNSSSSSTSDQGVGNSSDEDVIQSGDNPEGETLEGDVIKVNTALVTIPVNVMDRTGKYVPNLRREDFHIFEDSVEQRIAYFATVDQPFTVALVIDTSNSTHFRLEDIQDAAIAFVNQLKPEDRVMVISFDDDINVLTKPTSDRGELTRAIRRTHTGGGTRLYDAVDLVINRQLKNIQGRKAIVLFTDGVDTTSHRASYNSTLRDAEELDATVYPVAYDTEGGFGTGGRTLPLPGGRGGIVLGLPFPRLPGQGGGVGGGPRGSSPADYARAREYLHGLADRTGGGYYRGDSLMGVSQAFTWIAEELRRQYSLGYYPKVSGQDGERRQIKVRVNRSELVVKARDHYVYSQKRTDAQDQNGQKFKQTDSQSNHLSGTP